MMKRFFSNRLLSGHVSKWSAAMAALALAQAGAAEEVMLEIDYEPGKRYVTESAQAISMKMAVAGQQFESKTTIEQGGGVEVTEREAGSGGKVLTVEYDRIKVEAEAMGQKTTYDSEAGGQGSPLAAGFAGLLNKPAVLELNEAGEVVSYDDGGSEMTSDQVQQMLSVGENSGLPQQPVAVGDEWSVTRVTDLGQMGSIELEADFKLEGIEEIDGMRVATISFEGKMTGGVSGENSPIPAKFSDDGTITGTMKLDLDRKVFLKQTVNMDSAIEMQGQSMPARIESEQRLLKIEDL